MAMIPFLQFRNWQWLSLTLAAPVVIWGALPFHRAAWANARHGAATMDTLISIGTLSAFAWSLYALFIGDAGVAGMKMTFDLTIARGSGTDDIYLEVASAVTTFILAGRYFEARAKRRSGAALRTLLELGAKEVTVLRDGREERIAVDRLVVGDRFVARPGEKIATDGVIEDGTSAIDSSLLTGESVPVEVGPGDNRHRRHGQRRWPPGGARHQGRCRHPVGADGASRNRGPERQGRGSAPGRPCVWRLRPSGDRGSPWRRSGSGW